MINLVFYSIGSWSKDDFAAAKEKIDFLFNRIDVKSGEDHFIREERFKNEKTDLAIWSMEGYSDNPIWNLI